MQLAEESLEQSAGRVWAQRAGAAALVVLGVLLLVWLLRSMVSGPSSPMRQVAKIAILPDTPPPPPPPKEEPKKEPPKQEQRPVQQQEPKPQQAPPPQAAPLKMEGQAGDGPSAFQAGSVTQDYIGGPTNTTGQGSPADRMQERMYVNSVKQLLRDEIERRLEADAGEQVVSFAMWVEPDGRVRRFELLAGDNSARDAQLQRALDASATALHLPPPGTVPQPLRFRLTVRSQG